MSRLAPVLRTGAKQTSSFPVLSEYFAAVARDGGLQCLGRNLVRKEPDRTVAQSDVEPAGEHASQLGQRLVRVEAQVLWFAPRDRLGRLGDHAGVRRAV